MGEIFKEMEAAAAAAEREGGGSDFRNGNLCSVILMWYASVPHKKREVQDSEVALTHPLLHPGKTHMPLWPLVKTMIKIF